MIDILLILISSDVDYLVQEINKKEPSTSKHNKKLEKVINSK